MNKHGRDPKKVFLLGVVLICMAYSGYGCERGSVGVKQGTNWQPTDIAALYSAVYEGNTKAIDALVARFGKELLDSPLPAGSRSAGDSEPYAAVSGRRALHIAVEINRYSVLEALLKLGAVPDVQDQEGLTPLALAVQHECKKCVDILLERGAGVDVRDAEGETPLHVAITRNNFDIAKALLTAGADPNARVGPTPAGFTPLHLAALTWQNKAIAEILVQAGASANARIRGGVTPATLAQTTSIVGPDGKRHDNKGFLDVLRRKGGTK